MNEFHNELQMLNIGDFNTSEAVALDPNGSFSTQSNCAARYYRWLWRLF